MNGFVFCSRDSLLIVWLLLLMTTACHDDEISREVGAKCEGKSDCAELCLVGDKFPGGFCSTSCFSDQDCSGQTRCVRLTELSICMFPCNSMEDCGFMGDDWNCISSMTENDRELIDVCSGKML